jgi:hypothetical protein
MCIILANTNASVDKESMLPSTPLVIHHHLKDARILILNAPLYIRLHSLILYTQTIIIID